MQQQRPLKQSGQRARGYRVEYFGGISMRNRFVSRLGLSMLEVLVAVAITAIIVSVFGVLLKNQSKSDKMSDIILNYETARRYIRQNLDCDATLLATPCVAQQNIDLKNAAGEIFVSATESNSMNWHNNIHLYGKCIGVPAESPTEYRLVVFARMETAEGSNVAAKNPINGNGLVWKKLFQVPICFPMSVPTP